MEYRCKLQSVDRLVSSRKGFIFPLCETCVTFDCTNPIEKRKVSIIGIKKDIKVYSKGEDVNIVIGCEGYMNNEK